MAAVILFGGSFDPVHRGHLALAERAWRLLEAERVIWIPCRQSPHKSLAPRATAQQRHDMLSLATRHLPWAVVDGCELARAEPSFSWQTAEHFAGAGAEELYWLMGADQWAALPRWARPERLAELVTFVVFAREGHTPQSREGFRMVRLPGEFCGSATQVRHMVAAKRLHELEDFVTKEVGDYIRRNRLYTNSQKE